MFIRRHQEVYGNTNRDEPTLDSNNSIIDFSANKSNSVLF